MFCCLLTFPVSSFPWFALGPAAFFHLSAFSLLFFKVPIWYSLRFPPSIPVISHISPFVLSSSTPFAHLIRQFFFPIPAVFHAAQCSTDSVLLSPCILATFRPLYLAHLCTSFLSFPPFFRFFPSWIPSALPLQFGIFLPVSRLVSLIGAIAFPRCPYFPGFPILYVFLSHPLSWVSFPFLFPFSSVHPKFPSPFSLKIPALYLSQSALLLSAAFLFPSVSCAISLQSLTITKKFHLSNSVQSFSLNREEFSVWFVQRALRRRRF